MVGLVQSIFPDRQTLEPHVASIYGRLASDGPITRILCLKLDHVGDLLIAAPALVMLRKSFADAHITLVCGPWNVGLARRLRVADEIHPLSFFATNSSEEESATAVQAQRDGAMEALLKLGLPHFDLAIDLRRDEDTRQLLKLIDARYHAGFGDLATFSYLDVALPHTRHMPAAGLTSLRLRPPDLDAGQIHRVNESGLHLTGASGSINVQMATDAAWSPSEDGGPDLRILGAALWRVEFEHPSGDPLRPAMPVTIDRRSMTFGPGWLDWESWGRWTNTAAATFRIDLPMKDTELRLLVRVQGHTSPSHPYASVTLTAAGARAEHVFRAGDEPATLALDVRPTISAAIAQSHPHLLRGGRYRGEVRVHVTDPQRWEPLTVTFRGGYLKHVIAQLALPENVSEAGPVGFPFEVEIRDSGEPVVMEIESRSAAHAGETGVLGLDMDWQQGKYPPLPTVHMEQQLLDLAAMVALRYAPRLVTGEQAEIANLLARGRSRSSAADATHRLRRRRRGARWRGRRPRKLVGVGIGANKPTKMWAPAHFVDLCRRLLADPAIDLVFIGGPAEAADVARIIDTLAAGERAVDLTASCEIGDLGEVLAQLDTFVGLDTGTTHFAGRVGVPTLAIFGAAHDPVEWGPVGEHSEWVAAAIACSGCSFSTLAQCAVDLRCMTSITPDDVWPMLDRLVQHDRKA